MNIKMNKSDGEETIVCPVCEKTSEIIRVASISVDTTPLLLHDDVGKIYQCMNPECMEYLEKVNDEFKHITKQELIRRQKEITDLLVTEAEIARARVAPTGVAAAIAKAEAGRALSAVLYHLTSETAFHRAYTVEEILDACNKLGFNPLEVDNRRIGFVLNWLREYKD